MEPIKEFNSFNFDARKKKFSYRPVYDLWRQVEYELDGSGKLRICERDATFLQYEMTEIAVFLLTGLIEECEDDLLFFVTGLLDMEWLHLKD